MRKRIHIVELILNFSMSDKFRQNIQYNHLQTIPAYGLKNRKILIVTQSINDHVTRRLYFGV